MCLPCNCCDPGLLSPNYKYSLLLSHPISDQWPSQVAQFLLTRHVSANEDIVLVRPRSWCSLSRHVNAILSCILQSQASAPLFFLSFFVFLVSFLSLSLAFFLCFSPFLPFFHHGGRGTSIDTSVKEEKLLRNFCRNVAHL